MDRIKSFLKTIIGIISITTGIRMLLSAYLEDKDVLHEKEVTNGSCDVA